MAESRRESGRILIALFRRFGPVFRAFCEVFGLWLAPPEARRD
jgi:hypothetical protein